jgi:spore germination cell wall hydrolase CwlJ-like protein
MNENRKRTLYAALLVLAVAGLIAAFVAWQPQNGPLSGPGKPKTTVALDDDAPKPEEPLIFQAVPPETAQAMNAARPDYVGDIVAARGFSMPGLSGADGSAERALDCLAAAIYYEARSESLQGQRAVAQVVLNRVRDPLFPASVCGVVFQGSERVTGCQFSFTCDGSMAIPPRQPLWDRVRAVARVALAGYVETSVGLATHYHTQWVVPVWRTDLVKLRTIGAHIFYSWKGRQVSASGLRTSYAGFEPPLMPGMSANAAIPGAGENVTDMPMGSFAATPDQNGPIAALGANTTPPPPNLNADIHAGALAPKGSQLKLDEAPKPTPDSGGAPQ